MRRRGSTLVTAPISVVGIGDGGVEELRSKVSDASVTWALLRFEIGEGAFARTKFVAVHINGEDVPVVKRGRLNARTAEVLSQFGDVHATIEVKRSDELQLDVVLERLKPYFITDGGMEKMNASGLKEMYEKRIAELQAKTSKAKDEKASASKVPTTLKEKQEQSGQAIMTAAQAFKIVGAPKGPFNWLLLESPSLDLHNAGYGGLPEMKNWLDDKKVLFGLIRFSFGMTACGAKGEKMPSTVKHIFVHWIGPGVPAVRRGQLNAKAQLAETTAKGACAVTFRKSAHSPEDLELMDMISELRRLAVVDGSNSDSSAEQISVEEYMASLEAELVEQMEPEEEEAGAPDVKSAVERMKGPDATCNWTLLGPQTAPAGGGRASIAQAKNGSETSSQAPTPPSSPEKGASMRISQMAKVAEEPPTTIKPADAASAMRRSAAPRDVSARPSVSPRPSTSPRPSVSPRPSTSPRPSASPKPEAVPPPAQPVPKAAPAPVAAAAVPVAEAPATPPAPAAAAPPPAASVPAAPAAPAPTPATVTPIAPAPPKAPAPPRRSDSPRRSEVWTGGAAMPETIPAPPPAAAVRSRSSTSVPQLAIPQKIDAAQVVAFMQNGTGSKRQSRSSTPSGPRKYANMSFEPKRGMMDMRTGWRWRKMLFELRKGNLRWWSSEKDIGGDPVGSIRLVEGDSRWQITSLRGTRIELRCVHGYYGTGAPRTEKYTLAAGSAEEATDWAKKIWEHIAYIDMLLVWPMPLEGRQGDVRNYNITVP